MHSILATRNDLLTGVAYSTIFSKKEISKKLSIQLSLNGINEGKIDELQELFKMHKGNHSLNFVIYDDEDSIKVNLKSRKQKIKISQELLSDLDSRKVFYKLN